MKLCNKVYKTLTEKHHYILPNYIDEQLFKFLSCFLVSYFEDVISETNIWGSFIEFNQELYHKTLPFYETKDYYEGEINEQDIRFLIWYFSNIVQTEFFVNPNINVFFPLSLDIMRIFEEEYEYAPENKELKKYYELSETENYYFHIRNLIDTILFKTYLFFPDTALKLFESEREIFEEKEDSELLESLLYDNRVERLYKSHTGLLSLTGKEWAAKIIGENHPVSRDLLNMSQRVSGFFLYKGQDSKNVFIEHIASGRKFNLTKKSFDYAESLKEIDTIIYMGIAKWKEEWWFSGVYIQEEFNADLVLEVKNSIENRMAVNFLDSGKERVKKILERQLKVFKKMNNGSQIVFLPSDRIEDFTRDFLKHYEQSLKLTEEEREKAKARAREDGFLIDDEKKKNNNISDKPETGLVFFNPKSGIEIAYEVNSAFPVPENKYFKEEDSEEQVINLLFSENYSAELAYYCIDNFKDKLPFFQTGKGKEWLEDIDFLLRFWKKDVYHPVPTVTLLGEEEQ